MESIHNAIAEFSFNEQQSILHVCINDNAIINLENIRLFLDTIKEITGDRKHYLLIDADNYFTIEQEALNMTGIYEPSENKIATVLYTSNLANRIIFHFLKSRNKQPATIHLFKTKKKALSWLQAELETSLLHSGQQVM